MVQGLGLLGVGLMMIHSQFRTGLMMLLELQASLDSYYIKIVEAKAKAIMCINHTSMTGESKGELEKKASRLPTTSSHRAMKDSGVKTAL